MDSDKHDAEPDLAKEARAYYARLRDLKLKGKAHWWGAFEVLLEGHEVFLNCLRCNAKLRTTNLSRASSHLESKACIRATAASTAAAEAAARAAAATAAAAAAAVQEDPEVLVLGKRQRASASASPQQTTWLQLPRLLRQERALPDSSSKGVSPST